MFRIVCISDTHTLHDRIEVPEGDILLHAGDIMNSGYDSFDVFAFCNWYDSLPHKHKIFIAGNHDRFFENYPDKIPGILEKYPNILYLQDKEVVVEGIKIYGSPWQPAFCSWAFNLSRGEELKKVWNKIPDDTDLLITHGPPFGILDKTIYTNENAGCEELLPVVKKIKPILHLFGHIHEGYGVSVENDITFVNASVCTLKYNPSNPAIVFDLDLETKTLIQVF